jgi:Ca2+-binding EF-hand superfamily protein
MGDTMTRRLLAIGLFFGLLALAARADDQTQPKKKPSDAPKKAAGPEQIIEFMLQRFDRNKDGKLSKDECPPRIAENFERFDANKNGQLEKEELLSMARRFPPGGDGKGPFGRPGFGSPAADPNDFDTHDKDADGRLTRAELKTTRFADSFDQIDTNKDGKIDPKEWAAHLAKKKP